jgi:beta-glucosidase
MCSRQGISRKGFTSQGDIFYSAARERITPLPPCRTAIISARIAAALSASWNVDLLHEMGQALAEESIALGVDIILGPGSISSDLPYVDATLNIFPKTPFLLVRWLLHSLMASRAKGLGHL